MPPGRSATRTKRSNVKSTCFSRSAVDEHIRCAHPRIPAELAAILAERISSREWRLPLTIGRAFALAAQAYVRHEMTDYDRILRVPGLTREEALLIVKAEVQAIMDAWAGEKARPEPEVASRSALSRRPARSCAIGCN